MLDQIMSLKKVKINLKLRNNNWIIETFKMDQLVFVLPFSKKFYQEDFFVSVVIFQLIS